jgi:hypothetical protein
VEWCTSNMSTTTSLNGESYRRGLGDERLVVDSCRVEALSGAMAASTTGPTMVKRISAPRMDHRLMAVMAPEASA